MVTTGFSGKCGKSFLPVFQNFYRKGPERISEKIPPAFF